MVLEVKFEIYLKLFFLNNHLEIIAYLKNLENYIKFLDLRHEVIDLYIIIIFKVINY